MHPDTAVLVEGELGAGAPSQALPVARDRRHGDVDGAAGQSRELLAHHLCLEATLRRQRDVLEVAAAAATGIPAGRAHPVRGGEEHLDGIGPQEAVTDSTFGDLRDDPLTREGMADKEHAPLVAGDAMSPVGDRADLDLDAVPDGQVPHQDPRRTSPAIGRFSSSRSRAWSEPSSCHGTLETMTPGVKSSRARSRRALWL